MRSVSYVIFALMTTPAFGHYAKTPQNPNFPQSDTSYAEAILGEVEAQAAQHGAVNLRGIEATKVWRNREGAVTFGR